MLLVFKLLSDKFIVYNKFHWHKEIYLDPFYPKLLDLKSKYFKLGQLHLFIYLNFYPMSPIDICILSILINLDLNKNVICFS